MKLFIQMCNYIHFYTTIFRLKNHEKVLGSQENFRKTKEKKEGDFRLGFSINADEGLVENDGGFRSKFGVSADDFRSKFGENILQTVILINDTPNTTAKIIAEKLNVSKRTAENYLAKLKANNILERIGSDKTGYWKIIRGHK